MEEIKKSNEEIWNSSKNEISATTLILYQKLATRFHAKIENWKEIKIVNKTRVIFTAIIIIWQIKVVYWHQIHAHKEEQEQKNPLAQSSYFKINWFLIKLQKLTVDLAIWRV